MRLSLPLCLLGVLMCLTQTTPCFAQITVPTYTVSTFAGSAPLGDGGPAASAILRWPGPLVFDNAGNLYIADEGNASVRKVTPDGLITRVAGTGEAGFSGDGGPASRAQLSGVLSGLAIDSGGNIYITDTGNNRIRRISAADGRISTFVDGPTLPIPVTAFSFVGIAFDGADNLYIANQASQNNQIFQIAPDGTFAVIAGIGKPGNTGDGGPATQAAFNAPAGLYIDASGTIYVSDFGFNRIRKITPDGIITAFAGTGKSGFGGDGGPAAQALLSEPAYMIGDAGGNLYFLDYGNSRVRRVAADGTISTIAGSGSTTRGGDGLPATQAGFQILNGIALSAAGDLYISEFDSGIRVVTAADGIIRTAYGRLHFVADGTLASDALFNVPETFVADAQGNFYLGDWYRVRKIDTSGVISTIAGNVSSIVGPVVAGNSGDGGPATAAAIARPYSIAVDAQGNVYFDSASTVRRVGADGIITTVAGGGTSLGDGGPATNASISSPTNGLAVDSSGSLYMSDVTHHRIRKVTPDGTISTFAGTGATGVSNGDGGPATAAAIQLPRGLAFDAAGNLYFADSGANRVRVISPDGTISTFAGTGTAGESGDGGPATLAKLNGPWSVAFDPAGSVYIADNGGNTLRVVTTDGMIHTIASGNPVDQLAAHVSAEFSGDGGPAIGADYTVISGIALDGSGNIYLLDIDNERIRVLTPNLQ